MPTTSYTNFDIIDASVIRDEVFHHGSDLATSKFEVNASGSFTNSTPSGPNIQARSDITGNFYASVDHTTPVLPVATDAHITNIEIRFNITGLASGDASAAGGIGVVFVEATCDLTASVNYSFGSAPTPTTIEDLSITDHQEHSVVGSEASSVAAGIPSTGRIVRAIWDFTSAPPGYITQTEFQSFFTNVAIQFTCSGFGWIQFAD